MRLYITAAILLTVIRFYDFAFQHRGFYFVVVVLLALFWASEMLVKGNLKKKRDFISIV